MVSNALTTLNLTGANHGATVTAVAGERALTVNMNNVTGGTLTNAQATAITLNTTGNTSSGVTVAATLATSQTIKADETLTLSALDANAATDLTIKGDSLVHHLRTGCWCAYDQQCR